MVSPPHFGHEKLDVYQLELKFLSWVTQFLADLSSRSLALTRELREELDRASLSALLNTAEGNGRRQGRQREMLVRIVAMLTKLLMRFDPEQYRVHESAADLAAPFEHEHDDEHD
jgi:hypothetical protein